AIARRRVVGEGAVYRYRGDCRRLGRVSTPRELGRPSESARSVSGAPSGLFPLLHHHPRLTRGLHSCAASRLASDKIIRVLKLRITRVLKLTGRFHRGL